MVTAPNASATRRAAVMRTEPPAPSARRSDDVDRQDADEEAGEDGLSPDRQQDYGRDHLAHRARRVDVAEGARLLADGRQHQPADSSEHHKRAGEQADLERHVLEDALELWVRWVEAHADGEDLREHREKGQLVAQQRQEAGHQERMDVEPHTRDAKWAGDQERGEYPAEGE